MRKSVIKQWQLFGRALIKCKGSNCSEFKIKVWAVTEAGALKKIKDTYGIDYGTLTKI